MNKKQELITKKYNLATSDVWREIKKFQMDYLISLSSSESQEKYIIGGLNLIKLVDNWVSDFEKEIEKEKRN